MCNKKKSEERKEKSILRFKESLKNIREKKKLGKKEMKSKAVEMKKRVMRKLFKCVQKTKFYDSEIFLRILKKKLEKITIKENNGIKAF